MKLLKQIFRNGQCRRPALIGAMLMSVNMVAQESQGTEMQDTMAVSVEQLRLDINAQKDEYPSIKNKDAKIEHLELMANDLFALVDSLDCKIEELESKQKTENEVWQLLLLAEDESVFRMEDLKGRMVPAALSKHYETVCKVWDIEALCDDIRNVIKETKEYAANKEIDLNKLIGAAIDRKKEELYSNLKELKAMDQSTLSAAQLKHIGSLREFYLSLEPYFNIEQ
ncbi:MAG: hypothetical protein Q4F07_00430 [Bacteroidales bacterium]|nr:hypothetical protein [Bacteroidales bacterium]